MNKDLTTGKPEKVLWQFCLPLFGSIIFQQLYNIADSFVAGKFISDNALAAVGNSYEITLIFIAFAFGCNIACSVLAALFFGAKQYNDLKTTVYTALISSCVICAVLMLVGTLCCDSLLRLIKTPEEVFEDSKLYLDIYIYGLPFVFLYNVGNLKHGGQIVLQIDRCSAAAGKREGLDVFQPREFAEDTSGSRLGHAPALAKFGIGNERAAGAVSQINHRASFRAGNLMVVVDRVQPEIEQSVHFGAFSKTEQPGRRAHGQKEEAGILLARAAIIQHSVIVRPVENAVLHKLSDRKSVV